MHTNRSTMRIALVIGLTLLSALRTSVAQQPTPRDRIRALLLKAVPTWDSTILDVAARDNWSKGLSLAGIFAAVDDQKAVPKDLPPGLDRLRVGETSVRVTPETGRLRYISNERAWNPDSAPKRLSIDSAKARDAVLAAVRKLEVPQAELATSTVVTQVGAAGPISSAVATDTVEMYRVVTLSRQINKIPVYDSRVLATVNDRGAIQRLSADWPPFRLKPEMKVRARAEVIEETVSQILAQSPTGRVGLSARLVYAPRDEDDDNVSYVPSVVVSVTEPPTPYVIAVPVAR